MVDFQEKIMRLTRLLFAVIIVLLLAISVVEAKDVMPEFSLVSVVDKEKVTSKEFSGQVLLVTFFATWCPPCRQEIPTLIKLQKKYAAKGFSVIGLSMDEKGPKIVQKLIAKENINYPILMSNSKTERGFGGIAGIPTSFVIDREGKIIKRFPGYVPYSLLAKEIKPLL